MTTLRRVRLHRDRFKADWSDLFVVLWIFVALGGGILGPMLWDYLRQ